MKANLARGWILGCLVACLGATTASCDGDESPPPLTDLERGTIATTRQDTCGVESWLVEPFSVYAESLPIWLSVFPESLKRGVDCTLAAHNCQEVEACLAYFAADIERFEDLNLPECGSDPTDHCEGNVAKFCVSNDQRTWYEASYDCTLAGATCIEGQAASGQRWADCQAPRLQCEGTNMSYCDGTRAVVCDETGRGVLNPWAYDCADAFGSHCIDGGSNVYCEGPETGERKCDDGIDGDGDDKVDCDDDDCQSASNCP